MAAVPYLQSRTQQRRELPDKARIVLLEGDVDKHEFDDDQFHDRIEKKLDRLNAMAFSILLSMVGTAMTLIATLIVRR